MRMTCIHSGTITGGTSAGYAAFILYVSWPIALGNVNKAGVFGDSFGVITSLFSGLAFAGIILTIFCKKRNCNFNEKS